MLLTAAIALMEVPRDRIEGTEMFCLLDPNDHDTLLVHMLRGFID